MYPGGGCEGIEQGPVEGKDHHRGVFNMAKITRVRLSGLGAQGMTLAGFLLGQAGVIDGRRFN